MRIISLFTIFRSILNNRKRLIITVAVVVLCMLTLSFKKLSGNQPAQVAYDALLANFNTDLDEKQDSIEAQKERIAVGEKELAELKEYCDNAIYMKLSETGFYCGEAQYAITNSETVGPVLNGYLTYLSSSDFRNDLAKNTDEDEKYLQDVITYNNHDNFLRLYISHYDEKMAEKLLSEAGKLILARKSQIASTQGSHDITESSSVVGVRTDIGITNAQNDRLNTYKNYNTDLTNEKNKLSDMEQDIQTFIEENHPVNTAITSTKGKIKYIIKNIIIGLISSVILLFAWELAVGLYSGKLYSDEYCKELKLDCHEIIKGKYDESKVDEMIKKLLTDIQLSMDASEKKNIFIAMGQNTESSYSVAEKIKINLTDNGYNVVYGSLTDDNIEVLTSLSKADGAILFLQRGAATYNRVDNFCALVNRYKIDNMGYFEWINA